MAVYGIDLGTTYSCIASIDDVGRPAVQRNLEGTDTTPSVVFFESGENVVVGQTAKDTAVLEPDNVVSLIKRDMGRDVTRPIHGIDFTPEEVSAFILLKLATDARTTTGEETRDVVITVPAYFGVAERDATRKAGRIAGLNVIDIVSEPIAAAITYGVLNPESDRTILVYDLGGGTFDTTVIALREGHIEVVCTDGDHELGGADWDARLVSTWPSGSAPSTRTRATRWTTGRPSSSCAATPRTPRRPSPAARPTPSGSCTAGGSPRSR